MSNVGGSQDAGKYYEKADDYYTKDSAPSAWQGKAAEVLGLKGEVEIEQFKQLLDGNLPDGTHIHVPGKGRRGGTDLTFSAPKSVSMQALIGGDERLIQAHDQAVAKALAYAEELISYRQTEKGETKTIRSSNMVAATFRHELSRACDPQLHTHSVILNLTQREDKQWRAMDNELLYRDKMLMGALYRSELAREVQKLGYEVTRTRQDGLFELAQFSDQQLEAFSERSQAIEAAVTAMRGKSSKEAKPGAEDNKEMAKATAREKEIIALATRPKKTDVDREALYEYWQEKSRGANISYSKPPQDIDRTPQLERPASESLNFAMEHATERQAVVEQHEILRFALQHGVTRTTFDEVKQELERQAGEGAIIRAGERYTTQQAQDRERDILAMEKQGRGEMSPILTREDIFLELRKRGLNADQQDAAAMILTTQNQIVGVQGIAGSGKTRTLQAVRELAEASGYQMKGLAPSTGATGELLRKGGIESQNLTAFERSKDKGLTDKTLLVVDEAGMVSAKQMHFVIREAKQSGARVLLTGDTEQLKAVEAGKPFDQLQQNGMATAWIRDNIRQRTPHLKKAVKWAFMRKVKESVELIHKEIHEIRKTDQRHSAIAQSYAHLSPEEREQTLVVSGSNKSRKAINQAIRQELGQEGQGENIEILERKDLTRALIKETESYQIGDLVKPHRPYRSMGLNNGDLCKVVAKRSDYLMLEKPGGGRIRWNPKRHAKFSAYELKTREMAIGDKIRITENDHERGLVNGDLAKVVGFKKGHLKIQKEDGQKVKLDHSKPLHVEHGYCSTVHAAQGKDRKRVLIDVDTKSLTTAQDNYYVAISRAEREAKLYTNDRKKLPEAMSRINGKTAALEIHQSRKIQELRPVPSIEIRSSKRQAMELER